MGERDTSDQGRAEAEAKRETTYAWVAVIAILWFLLCCVLLAVHLINTMEVQ